MQVAVSRKNTTFNPDPSRVITRFLFTGEQRAINTIRFVMEMTENDASTALKQTLRDYSMRHRNISKIFEKHFNRISHLFQHLKIDPNTIEHSR